MNKIVHAVPGIQKKFRGNSEKRLETATLLKATELDFLAIWEILQDAIAQRKADDSDQWQNGYPNQQTVRDDIAAGNAYLLVENDVIVAYAAIIFDNEPAYDVIDGQWLTDGKYAVIHRIARPGKTRSKGLATKLLKLAENLCIKKNVRSIRLDTNFDNAAMLKILENLNYSYCGEVLVREAPRRAYEKILSGLDGPN